MVRRSHRRYAREQAGAQIRKRGLAGLTDSQGYFIELKLTRL